MSTFTTNRSLLNPKFEGYRLSPLTQDEHVVRIPLNFRPTQATVSGRTKTPLSFEEVQSRITHNHLVVAHDGESALYVDENLNVVKVVLTANLEPVFQVLCELPRPIQRFEDIENSHREYPSAVSLPNSVWLVSDGTGLLYVLTSAGDTADISASYYLPNGSAPFRIHTAHVTADNKAICILSCRNTGISRRESGSASNGNVNFDLWSVVIDTDVQSGIPQALRAHWHGQGSDVPMFSGFDDSRELFYVLGSGLYRQPSASVPPSYEPSIDEIAPVPRAGEVFSDVSEKPPPYSWTQTSDSVTIAFPLPSNIPKSSIHVTLTSKTLSLLIKHELPTSVPLPRYSLKQLWDSINPSSSFWTWDKEADKQFGLLTLHLDKQREDLRWMHVFASVGTKPAGETNDPTDEEVPETLDPSELYQIREALEKYTSALRSGEDASGFGLGSGVPSLADGELDEAVDTNFGRKFWVTWIGVDGATPSWAGEEGVPSFLLSTPLPGLRENSLVIKNDIDGLFVTLPPASDSVSPAAWTHTSTYSALAFVLASKRDNRFTYHISSEAVFAFESGTSFGSGNVFIYRGTKGRDVWAKQAILKVSGGSSGALLGVGAARKEGGCFILLCLCENELLIVRDLA